MTDRIHYTGYDVDDDPIGEIMLGSITERTFLLQIFFILPPSCMIQKNMKGSSYFSNVVD